MMVPTIESVIAQEFESWELVIVDDGSTDASSAVAVRLASRDDRIIAASFPNGGVATARNRGFALTDAGTEFVAFLDSDEVWFPDTLRVLVAALDRHPRHVAAHGLPVCIDSEGRRVLGDDIREIKRRRLAWSAGGTVPIDATAPTEFGSFLLENWCVSPGTSLIRRDALERVGPFDRAVAPADDWDLNIRLSRLGPFGFVDRPVLEWRRHDATLTNTSSRWRDSYLATLAKSVWDPANTADQRRLASSCFRHGRAEAARDTLDLVLAGRGRDAGSSAVHAVLGWWHHVRAARRRRGRTDSVPSERRP